MVGPEPSGGQAVHYGVNEGEEAVRVEVAPLGDPSGHDRRRRSREGELEIPKHILIPFITFSSLGLA